MATPDLRGRFIVGYTASDADYNLIGKTGGAKQVTLTAAQMPSHTHGVNETPHSHGLQADGTGPQAGFPKGAMLGDAPPNFDAAGVQPALTGITLQNAGGGGAHENRPPFYALAFVMRTE